MRAVFSTFRVAKRRRRFISPSKIAAGTISITTPKQYQVFQRSGSTGTIAITGTYTGSVTAVEASFNGGAYATIDAAPAGGNFSGSLTSQAEGQGTLTVRFTNDTGVTATQTYVGVGEVIVTAGQSNSMGQATSNQTYQHPTLKASKYTSEGGGWEELVDPYDTYGGSQWQHTATALMAALNVPIAFIAVGANGSSITTWITGQANYTGAISEIADAVGAGTGKVRVFLWHQGESDALSAMSQATYNGHLDTLASNVQSDLGVKLMPCILQDSTGITDGDEDAIRDATVEAIADNANVLEGPDFSELVTTDSYHPKTTAQMYLMGNAWAFKIYDAFFASGGVGAGPFGGVFSSPVVRAV